MDLAKCLVKLYLKKRKLRSSSTKEIASFEAISFFGGFILVKFGILIIINGDCLLSYYMVIFPDRVYRRKVICADDITKTAIQDVVVSSSGIYGDNINYRTISSKTLDGLPIIIRRYETKGWFEHDGISVYVFYG